MLPTPSAAADVVTLALQLPTPPSLNIDRDQETTMIELFAGSLSVGVVVRRDVSYQEAEQALVRQGFKSYLISRSHLPGETRFQLNVNIPVEEITAEGVPTVDAVQTLRSMADALTELDRA